MDMVAMFYIIYFIVLQIIICLGSLNKIHPGISRMRIAQFFFAKIQLWIQSLVMTSLDKNIYTLRNRCNKYVNLDDNFVDK